MGIVALGVAIVVALAVGLRFVTRSGFQDCKIGNLSARCGRVQVPENPADPSGRKISLNVAIFRATGANPKPDPLFWFSGWGGAGVSDDAAVVMPALRRVNADRDVVFVDKRGTGGSKLTCRLPPGSAARAASSAALTAAARRCADRIGPNLRYYTSAVAVDDVDRVRSKLGYDRINLYGGSYGVTTGQAYLLRHGSHVRSAVFDSGSLLDVRIFERAAPNAQRALRLMLARCATDTACRTGYPDLRSELAAIAARLAKTPIPAPGVGGPLTASGFGDMLEDLLASAYGKAIAPRVIHLVATGDMRRAAALVKPVLSTGAPLAYQLLIQCAEPWASWRPAQTNRLARGTFMQAKAAQDVRFAAAVCRGLPKAPAPASMGRRVHSRVPVLFLAGNEDPADPPANIANARRELPNSRTILFPRSGHGQLGLLCAQNLIADFIAAGSATGLDASCAKTAVQQEFDIRQ